MYRKLANALDSARYGDALPLHFPGPQPGVSVTTFDEQITMLSIERLVEMGQEMIDLVRAADLDAHVNANLGRGKRRAEVHNTAGA